MILYRNKTNGEWDKNSKHNMKTISNLSVPNTYTIWMRAAEIILN